jgi:hypothetical protein
MAWTAEEKFEYTNGSDLNGASGGSGFSDNWTGASSNISVQNSVTYQGTGAATATSASLGGGAMERDFTSGVTSGVYYIAMYRSSTSSGELRWNFRNQADNDSMSIKMNASGNIVLGSTSPVTVASYAANTWYVIRVTFDVAGNAGAGSYTAAVSTGGFGSAGTFGTESSSKTFQNSATTISHVLLDFGASAGTGVTNYWDYLSPTSPFTVAATPHNLSSLGAGA